MQCLKDFANLSSESINRIRSRRAEGRNLKEKMMVETGAVEHCPRPDSYNLIYHTSSIMGFCTISSTTVITFSIATTTITATTLRSTKKQMLPPPLRLVPRKIL